MRSRLTSLGTYPALWLIPLWLGMAAPAEAQRPEAGPERVRLFASDSMDVDWRVSLSPDGRWLAFSAMETPSTASLWIKRVDGGTPQRLTSAGHWDAEPAWSPSGDRLFFVSNRPARAGDHFYYGMVIPIDPRTGRAAGAPRQVTAEPVMGAVHPSPDGRLLAHLNARNRQELRVLPAVGGASRIVATLPPRSGNLVWTSDGEHLIYVTGHPRFGQRAVSRIPLSGGEPVLLARLNVPQGRVVIGPDAERFVLEENGDGPRERVLRVVDRQGRVLRTLAVDRNTRASAFAADGRSLIAVESNVVAPTRLMPVNGGAYRELTAPTAYDWVLGFTPDGSAVYSWTEEKGRMVLARIPLRGGARQVYPETADLGFQAANGRYLFQVTRRDGMKPRRLFAVDLRDGTRHTVSESLPAMNDILAFGPGGEWSTQEELFYYERDGERVHVKGWSGPGKERTVRTLPASVLERSNVAVHGERVAWQELRGDSMDLMIADGPSARPRRLLRMPFTAPGGNEISFSRDGRLLALHYTAGPGSPDLLAIVDAAGAGEPRIIDTGLSYWYWPRWLPDGSALAVIGGGAGAESHVVLVPLRPGAQPVNLTRGDPAPKWGFELSPDGRLIAYPGEIWRGSTVWKLELGAPALSSSPAGRR